jgi:aldehyde dehydrogenase (NAD+)
MDKVLANLGLEKLNPGTWASNGGWLSDPSAPRVDSINPATGEVIASVLASTPAQYEQVMASAREVALSWRQVPAPKRGEAVRLVGEELRRHKADLGSLVALEMGKIKAEGDGEVQEMIDIADFAVWSWNAFLAAICGNVSVWKPSLKTALCAVAVQHVCNRVLERHGYPGIFQLFVDAGHDIATRFVEDRRVDLVSFTGSTHVGREIGERVARRLGKSLLELGGNNAIIVDESANLDLAVPSVVFGAVGTAGQRCTTTRRVFVHESRLAELERRLQTAYRQVRIGDPLAQGTLMGPLIDAAAVRTFVAAVAKAVASGGHLLAGGKALDRPGYFVEPAIVRAHHDWEIVRTETFGPILYLIPFRTLDEAIAMQNDVAHGLSSAIFTDRLQHAERFLSASGSDCGIANVNIGTSGAEIGGAFGGEKDTGGGRESGSDSWKAYMRRQTCTVNWGADLPLAQGINFDVSA